MLCGEESTEKSMLEEALRESEFQLILNANPGSRVRVEAGRAKGGTWEWEATVNSLSKRIHAEEWGISRPLSLAWVCPVFGFHVVVILISCKKALTETAICISACQKNYTKHHNWEAFHMTKLLHKLG